MLATLLRIGPFRSDSVDAYRRPIGNALGALSGLLRSQRGTTAVEFALIAPALVLIAAAIIEFGLVFVVYNQTNRLASQFAMAWSDCYDVSGSCGTELNDYTSPSTIANFAPQLKPAKLVLQMAQVEMSGAAPKVTYPAGGTLTGDQLAAAQAAFTRNQIGVVVTVTYTHTLAFFPNAVGDLLNGFLTPSFTITQLKSQYSTKNSALASPAGSKHA